MLNDFIQSLKDQGLTPEEIIPRFKNLQPDATTCWVLMRLHFKGQDEALRQLIAREYNQPLDEMPQNNPFTNDFIEALTTSASWQQQLLGLITQPFSLKAASASLKDLKADGVTQSMVRDFLEVCRFSCTGDQEDHILEVLDIVEGWCATAYQVW